MEESDLQGNAAIFSQIQGLQLPVGGPVPDVQRRPVVTWNEQSEDTGPVLLSAAVLTHGDQFRSRSWRFWRTEAQIHESVHV